MSAVIGTVKLNEPVTFGMNGSIKNLMPFGFDLGESPSSWTTAQTAGFSLAIPPPQVDVYFQMTASPFLVEGRITGQQVFAFANGLWMGFHTFSGHTTTDFLLPRAALSSRAIRFTLVVPSAVSPNSLGLSKDLRHLGILISSVVISNKPISSHT
jgi:hypothetical protein